MFAPKVAKPQIKATEGPTSRLAPHRLTSVGDRLGHDPVEQALFLQRTIGNQATLRYLKQRLSDLIPAKGPAERREQEAAPENLAGREVSRGPSWDFSKIPIFPPGRADRPQSPSPLAATLLGAIPAKLAVGQANDPLEHEADRIADQVMRMPDPALSVSRAAPFCIAKDPASAEEPKPVRAERAAAAAQGGFEAPPIVHEVLRSSGQQLDALTRAFFEPRFGRDFSNVHIHDDAKAAQSARAVDASAYTVGPHIVFGAGRYQPRAQQGRNLLAHELGHVVQQSRQRGVSLQAQPADTTSQGFVPAPAPGVAPPPPPVPGSPDVVRAEAVEIGQKWGTLLADIDIALDSLQTKRLGISVWDRMKPEEKQDFANKVQQQFMLLPILPQYDKPDLIAAQDDGFASGINSGYSLEKFTAFLVKIGGDLAIVIFTGLAARGVRLPRFIANLMQRSLPSIVAPGTGVAFGEKMAEEMLGGGFKGNPFREFMARLNAAPVRLPPSEAAEAIKVATQKVSGGTMGTMPPIQQGDILVVPSRAPIPNAPVMGIRGDGTVIMGRAPKLDIITQDANGAPIFPPVARITGEIEWE